MLKYILLSCVVVFPTLIAFSRCTCSNYNFLVIYGNNNSEIIVKNVKSLKTVKIFTIQIKKPCRGIAVDYEKDLIFFADRKHVYRIHLVDENGNRKMSGEGELFINKTVDHFEMVFYKKVYSGYEIQNILFDDDGAMLYVVIYKCCTHSRLIVKLDPEDGYVTDYPLRTLANPSVLRRGMLYAATRNTIYNITVEALEHANAIMQPLTRIRSLSRFTVDKLTNRLFYTQHKNVLKIFDANLANTSISNRKTRVVMADGNITKNIQSIDVYGKIVLWASKDYNKLYIGGLNKKKNFVSKRNVHVLDAATKEKPYAFNNVQNIRTCF